MLKSFPIFKRNGAHLAEQKKCLKKTRTIHSQSLNALTCRNTFDLRQTLETMKNIPKEIITI